MSATSESARPPSYRWTQLVLGIICMVMIANLQYGWTFFVDPIGKKFGWSRSDIQYAFFLFVLFETWLVPIEGWFVDRFGPRNVVLIGGILSGLGWVMNAYADSLAALYAGMIVSGVGAGAVYGTCVGNALKWFADRRGLAVGLTAAGFGFGSALTVVPITNMIDSSGYAQAFLYFGIGQGVIVIILSLFLRAPAKGEAPAVAAQRQTVRDFTPVEMVQTPIFWVMYVMFVLVGAGGIMITANLAPIAKDFGIDKVPLALGLWTMTAVQVAGTLDRILNGLTRPFFGWVSDHIGRENTMFIAFGLEALGIWALSAFGHSPVAFAILSGIVFFAWGEIYSLFPSTCTDTYGAKYAATNAGLLYTAKGTASILTPWANKLEASLGGWDWIFIIAVGMNAIAALMALGVLKPLRASWFGSAAAARGTAARAAE